MSVFNESIVEDAALTWPEPLGHAVLHGADIAAGGTLSIRDLRIILPLKAMIKTELDAMRK